MTHQRWRIRQQGSPIPDGQHRWDRAYQHLLRWTQPQPTELEPIHSAIVQEV